MKCKTDATAFFLLYLLVALCQPVLCENVTDERELQSGSRAIVEGPFTTRTVAVAASQLPGGNVLLWSSVSRYDFRGPNGKKDGLSTYTEIFDPESKRSRETFVGETNHDMFCPGTAHLADGRIMVTGGSSANTVSIYDPTKKLWSKGPGMVYPRGYHSMTPLHDGKVFTIGGSWSGGKFDKQGEIWDENYGWNMKRKLRTWDLHTNDTEGIYRADNHMWLFQAPNGYIFHAGPSQKMHWFSLQRKGEVISAGYRSADRDAMCGNAVMYDIGKILTVGGSQNYRSGRSSKRAHVIDLNNVNDVRQDKVTVRRVGPMKQRRTFSNSVVLPSGEVVVVGGMVQTELFSDNTAVMFAEIWNPRTERFTRLSPNLKEPRTYHSVALLLKDARVFVAGGGLCGACDVNHFSAEIITPPYLLNRDGSRATRPVIEEVYPEVFRTGGTFTVTMNTSEPHTFVLIRLGSATHSTNNDQRRVPLRLDYAQGHTFTVSIKSNKAVVPPGPYYLFALDAAGVPSVGWYVRRELH